MVKIYGGKWNEPRSEKYYGLVNVQIDDNSSDVMNRLLYFTICIPIRNDPKPEDN